MSHLTPTRTPGWSGHTHHKLFLHTQMRRLNLAWDFSRCSSTSFSWSNTTVCTRILAFCAASAYALSRPTVTATSAPVRMKKTSSEDHIKLVRDALIRLLTLIIFDPPIRVCMHTMEKQYLESTSSVHYSTDD